MAAGVIAAAFFTVSFERFFNMILTGEIRKFVSGKKVDDVMRTKLKTMLLAINAVLNDAEKKQISDPNVRQWLVELKDTMFRAEDLVYELETEALRCKIEGGPSVFHQVTSFFSSRFSVGHVEDRIMKIFHTLEGIVDQIHLLPLSTSQGVHHHFKSSSSSSSPQLLPMEEESDVYGRAHDKAIIVNLLLSDFTKISVIPIVGMGGIGKTTLARLVYNDVNLMNHFELKAWVTVSDEFDVFTLTKTVFEIITNQKDCEIKHPEHLQFELKKVIEGKKFLFVLDDVWNKDYNLWDNFKSQFKFGAVGSKIIVTTRSENIGSMMGGNVPNHYLKILSEEDSWKIFAKHAFQNVIDKSAIDQDFDEIGRGIIRKCNGLPLALKSIGGLLSSRYSILEWKDIASSDTWKLQSNILPALWLSYHYLPPDLKRCFAYCSIFPKDYLFDKEKLILLWMAENLLLPQQNKTLEEVGEDYFNDLSSRSFFHCGEYGWFTMHDLLNDLAASIFGEFFWRMDDDDNSKFFTGKTRLLSCIKCKSHDMKKLEEYLSKNKVLRTLMFPPDWYFGEQYCSILEQYLKGMPYLRVFSQDGRPIFYEKSLISLKLIGTSKFLRYLDLSRIDAEELPDAIYTLYNLQTLILNCCNNLHTLSSSIGNLKNLRYLDMNECAKITGIPNTLCDLHDLRTLKLGGCRSLSGLPADLSRLVNLRYVDFYDTRVSEMPPKMYELKHLQHLSNFVVDKNGGHNMKELRNLQDLRGCLKIQNIENVENVGDVWEAKLKDKKHITDFELQWNCETDDSKKAREVLDWFQPHKNVRSVTIHGYPGTKFPSWVGHHSFSHIVSLYLIRGNCYLLPPLGQLPSLKRLEIWRFNLVEIIDYEFYGCSTSTPPFKSLEFLHLGELMELREWKDWSLMGGEGTTTIRAFSQLKTLYLSECPKINGECLPSNLLSSSTLQISRRCESLVASLQPHQLQWLVKLEVVCCPELVSFPPEGGLPLNIQAIDIWKCDKLKSLAKHGWPSNLNSLRIGGCKNLFADAGSFPEEGQLSATLTCLQLSHLPQLILLNGKALSHLVCLQRLAISSCHELKCLPENGLPRSLSKLTIEVCHPSLLERCKRDAGEDWPKIAHIPHLNIKKEY